MKEAALLAACRLNVGNLHYTGHSTESPPPAAMAEVLSAGDRAVRLLDSVTCRSEQEQFEPPNGSTRCIADVAPEIPTGSNGHRVRVRQNGKLPFVPPQG